MKKLTILLVDDSDRDRKRVADSLDHSCFELVEAKTGREALDKLDEIDGLAAIITDVVMPEMSGKELAENIRANKKYESLPIIVISGQDDVFSEVYELKNVWTIIKPVNPTMLNQFVKAKLLKTS